MACHDGVTREGLAHRARPERMRTRAHTPRNGRKPRSVKTQFSQRPTPPGLAALPSLLSSRGLPEAHPHPGAFAQAVPSAGNVPPRMSQSLCKCHLLRKTYLKFQPWEGNTQCNQYIRALLLNRTPETYWISLTNVSIKCIY